MRIALALLHVLLIVYCFILLGRRWQVLSRGAFWGAFLFRISAGMCLGLIYIYYYKAGDTWLFFEDAKKFSALARQDLASYLTALFTPTEPSFFGELATRDLRSVFFIKIISVFCVVSLDNYWVCSAYFSFFSFVSAWRLHREVVRIFPHAGTASAMGFLFLPSSVFWSSGLEKESMALCGIFLLATVLLSLMSSGKVRGLVWLLCVPAGFVIWNLKYYWAVVFLISALTAALMNILISRFPSVRRYSIATWAILFLMIGVLLSFTHPNFYLNRFLEVIVSNYDEFAAISSPRNLIHYYHFDQSWTSIVVNSPWALISGLFRPVIGEGQGVLGWAESVENFFLLVLFFGALRNFKDGLASTHRIFLLAALSYCAVLCIFLALSTPNFGTLSRYRVGFLPFFVFVLAYHNPWLANTIHRIKVNFN